MSNNVAKPRRTPEVTNLPDIGRTTKIYLKEGGQSYWYGIVESPTGNCQIASLVWAEVFPRLLTREETRAELKESLPKYALGKRLLLVDIQRQHVDKFKEFFDSKSIVMETPYTSTNGSLMTILLVSTRELFVG